MIVERSHIGKGPNSERYSPTTNSPQIRKVMAANRLRGRKRNASQAKARIPATTTGGIRIEIKIAGLD